MRLEEKVDRIGRLEEKVDRILSTLQAQQQQQQEEQKVATVAPEQAPQQPQPQPGRKKFDRFPCGMRMWHHEGEKCLDLISGSQFPSHIKSNKHKIPDFDDGTGTKVSWSTEEHLEKVASNWRKKNGYSSGETKKKKKNPPI
eukprot:TRINITY_DN17434_c0_g2_i2.p2 TRINITY_DN17434_c0_g2~~TRINITY_DN17434_c0_g2_i2.p2  ORF type:complete len:142 (+),score=21.06 TRINITY_DN17434_c0_g2_i2:297-722(+)